jgi:curli biogenesis system outer membrane secretion channel CsgG
MRNRRPFTMACAAAAGLALSCAMQSAITVDVQKPAAISLPGVHKIAIADFLGPEGSGGQIASLVQSGLMQSGFFEIIEREKLVRVLDEQKLGQSGIVNESTAKQVGQMLGVDALIFGEVTTCRVEPDETGTEKVSRQEGTGKYETVNEKNIFTGKTKKVRKEIMRTALVDQAYKIRRGTVAVSFRVVDVETGKLLAVRSDSKSYASDKVIDGSTRTLKPEGEILNELSGSLAQTFVQTIAPHKVAERRMIEPGGGKIQEGRKFAQSGLWPEAAEAWTEAVRLMPKNPSAYYNLGLAHEVQGNLDEAENLVRKAISIQQKKLYIDALSRIRTEKDEKVKLEQQLNSRQ